jgi:hypothetical protein
MKTYLGSAINNIAHGFAASYSTALTQLRGFSSDKSKEPVKPMVNTSMSAATAQVSLQAPQVENDLSRGKALNVTA